MIEFLRHTLATLAYRGGKAIHDVPAGFFDFRLRDDSRSAGEILAHICDLLDWALTQARGDQTWRDSDIRDWRQGVERFHAALEELDGFLAREGAAGYPAERIFQGPIADALTHVGQLAMMRRLAGAPVRGENFFQAEIEPGRVGESQAAPRREFD